MERERESGKPVLPVWLDDDDDDDIAIVGTIWLCVNEWIVLNWIISVK